MKEIFIMGGLHINEAYGIIQKSAYESGEICYGIFNDVEIYSNETIDEVYQKIYGKSREEMQAEWERIREEYDRKEQEHKAAIPTLADEYRKRARGIIPEESLELWDRIVPI